MDLKEIDILGSEITHHWYYRSKAAAMTSLIDRSAPSIILDVGAGSGFFSRYLLGHTTAQEAWCVDISQEVDSDALEMGKPVHYRRSVEAVDANLILFMDVLEHVEDDVGLLADYVRKVPKGARFVISVPAFRFLWSGHDEFLEHKRRYTRHQLENVVRRAGLSLKQAVYYFGLVFPIAVVTRLVGKWFQSRNRRPESQLKRHSHVVNSALTALCRIELPVLTLNRLAGLTVFCLATRT